jgi:hypothetical protein
MRPHEVSAMHINREVCACPVREAHVPYPWRGSPERGCRFLGEIRAARQHDLQRTKRAHIMTVELRVLLDPAKQLPEINLAGARGQVFFVAPVAVGKPHLLAASSS